MDWALGEASDAKAHVTGQEVFPAGRRSLLAVLKFKPQSTGHLARATKGLR